MIPKMTYELGKYWSQPKDIREAPMDDIHVILTQRQIEGLSEYSASMPSGVYPGKCWLWKQHPKFGDTMYLMWYGNYVPGSTNELYNEKRKVLVL